tara:strand:+ start:274 stop:741 length:468 start_codon:yes stop_codon:yes gene_type:complete
MTARLCLRLAAISGFLAVLFGAFGAHGLNDSHFLEKKYADQEKEIAGQTVPASYKYFQDFRTGVRYHMWHALALFGVGLLMRTNDDQLLRGAAWSLLAGMLLFSGSLYLLVIAGPKFAGVPWGLIAALGGTTLLIGWGLLIASVFRSTASNSSIG